MKSLSMYLAVFLVSTAPLVSQYYYIPFIGPGGNPGALNADNELPVGRGLPEGWSTILPGGNAQGVYSAVQTIPFDFSFNGNPVTEYKVSNSGILTFDVATNIAPGRTNVALPTPLVPKKAVCVWGITRSAGDENIVTKTFGVAPHRQHWISFSNFTIGSYYSYWSIVLEETSNAITIVDQRNQSGITKGLTLGVQIDSTSAAQVAGSPRVLPLADEDASPENNSYYAFHPGVQPGIDLAVHAIATPAFPNLATAPFTIRGTLRNLGKSTVTAMTVNYSIDNGTPVAMPLTGLNLPMFASYDFVHAATWTPPSHGSYTVTVWASGINGSNDESPDNDSAEKTIVVSKAVPNIIDRYNTGTPTRTVVATVSDSVNAPRDLDFHPDLARNELWIVNEGTDEIGGSTVTVTDAGQPTQKSLYRQDPMARHFLALPTGIAFADNGNFATSPGVYDANHDGGEPFTGPTLWSSDPAIYAQPSGRLGSHLDMLHESPYSMGIAHETDNVFWVFDANNHDVVRYDFGHDHGPGGDDHSDGKIRRFLEPVVSRIDSEIVCHMELDKKTGWLYIADNGSARVLRLNINSGTPGGTPTFPAYENYDEYTNVSGATWDVYAGSGLVQPSGIAVIGDRLLVGDYSNGQIVVFDNSGARGVELFRISTGIPGIMGIAIGPDGKIWYVNRKSSQVLRLDPDAASGVENATAQSMRLYPNPSPDGLFHLDVPQHATLAVSDALGRTVYQSFVPVASNDFTIDLRAVRSGVYFLRMQNGASMEVRKLVIGE